MEFFMIRMVQFMMGNGMRTKNQDMEKCYFKMDQYMMANGNMIKFMEKEFTFIAMVIDMRDILIMDLKKVQA